MLNKILLLALSFVSLANIVHADSGTMKLYYTPGACSLAVRIVINELKMKASFESVDLKEHKTESGQNFYDINPKGAVPTLVTKNGDILTENNVIMQYLADQDKSYKILPPIGNPKRYKVLEMANFISTEIHKGFAPVFNTELSDDAKSILVMSLKKKLSFMNDYLSSKKYLVGDNFTIADAYFVVTLGWFGYANIDINDFPNLKSYKGKMLERKSINDAMKAEGLI